MKKHSNNIFILIFAYLGFLIGAGVATGQEILQYYTPNGFLMFGVGIIIIAILFVANWCYSYAAKKIGPKEDNPFVFYFGKKIGSAIDWFCTIFCFFTYIIMISGGSTSLQQAYMLPMEIGILIISILAFITVIFGLLKFVKIIGYITPVIIILVICVSIINITQNFSSISENISTINSGSIDINRAGNTWWLAGISNGGFCLLMLAKFTVNLSKKNSLKKINIASLVSALILVLTNILIGFSLLSSINAVYNVQIPNLYIFTQIAPIFGSIFGLLIFMALYTSAAPLLWTVAIKTASEKSKKFTIVCLIITICASAASLIFDFSWLINNIYTYCGYVGFVVLITMIIRLIYIQKSKKNIKNQD